MRTIVKNTIVVGVFVAVLVLVLAVAWRWLSRPRLAGRVVQLPSPARQSSVSAAARPLPAPAHETDAELRARIAAELQSPDSRTRQSAIASVENMSFEDPMALAMGLRYWLDPLFKDKQYELIERVTRIAILTAPQSNFLVATYQEARVEALLALGKYDQALGEARSYFNVADLQENPSRKLLAIALGHATPKVLAAIRKATEGQAVDQVVNIGTEPRNQHERLRFKDLPAVDKDHILMVTPPLLAAIEVDPSPYIAALKKVQNPSTYDELRSRGNLLLLANRITEARKCYLRLCGPDVKLCQPDPTGEHLRSAIEGILRTLRAEDGTLKRATALLGTLRREGKSSAPVALFASASPKENVQELTGQIKLDHEHYLSLPGWRQFTSPPPALELAREKVQAAGNSSAGAVTIRTDFEGAMPMKVEKISPTHF